MEEGRADCLLLPAGVWKSLPQSFVVANKEEEVVGIVVVVEEGGKGERTDIFTFYVHCAIQ